ncbi:putative glycosomal membrane protein [Trypanosoma theileri]|uniref:Putative glycosomal membrane protein n=1 Tax=Trypanosoma theileri TaxID=67003 RepID=A0A1X0NJI5_9TRYP|nr:putative glycosomal membrane protein [Trypanosoma theileri]ORC84613.1 putative glycosomal membrane protein [Trypanosoma theileri]
MNTFEKEVIIRAMSKCLSTTDGQDKLLKGSGALMKLLFCFCGIKSLLDFADSASEGRSLLRLLSWLSNLQIVYNTLQKDPSGIRDVIYLARIIGDGIFKICDNVAFLGIKFQGYTDVSQDFARASRAGLFWGFFAAVMLSLYDLRYDRYTVNNKRRYITLVQNLCDLLTAASTIRFAGFEMNLFWQSLLTLVSVLLSCADCFRAATIKAKTS